MTQAVQLRAYAHPIPLDRVLVVIGRLARPEGAVFLPWLDDLDLELARRVGRRVLVRFDSQRVSSFPA